jgi:hypothetical protein
MGQASDPETLVKHQKLTPGNNQNNIFKQHYDHGGSFQLHTVIDVSKVCNSMILRVKIIEKNTVCSQFH